jgi:hypothetical protein
MNALNSRVQILAAISLVICIGLPMAAQAKGKSKKKPTPTKIEEAPITSIEPTAITISNGKPQAPRRGQVIGGNSDTTTSVTYKINALTDVEIDGQTATVNELHIGMSVSVSADPSDDMGPPNSSDGGFARTIVAHEAPTNTTASKSKSSK